MISDDQQKAIRAKLEEEKTRGALHLRVRDIAIAAGPSKAKPDGILAFDKSRVISEVVREELDRQGKFFRTADDHGYYFHEEEKLVYDLCQERFKRFLKQLTGLNETERYYKFLFDKLQTDVSRSAPRTEVYALAHFDLKNRVHYVSDGGGGIWWREPHGKWQLGHNGQDGTYFVTEQAAETFSPDFDADPEEPGYPWFWEKFLLHNPDGSDINELAASDAHQLLHVWILQQLFPEYRRTRIIPTFLGPMGGGKTTAARLVGRFLIGPRFEVIGIKEDGEKDFIAAVSNRTVVGFDNADSRVKWLPDQLARYATGQEYQMRELYKTNEEATYSSRAIILLTSRDPQFNRPDVAERLLPLTFERPKEYIEEEEIFQELTKRRNAMWGKILTCAAEIADRMNFTKKLRIKFRMADYGTFGLRVFGEDQRLDWETLLAKLTTTQARFATEGDSITTAIDALLLRQKESKGKRVIGPMSTGEFFKRLKPIAAELNLWFPDTANGFGRMLSNIRVQAESELGVSIKITGPATGNKRFITVADAGLLPFR